MCVCVCVCVCVRVCACMCVGVSASTEQSLRDDDTLRLMIDNHVTEHVISDSINVRWVLV